MMRTALRIDRWLLLVAIAISCCSIVGCEYFPESTFDLANESRLPKWFALPPGNTRADVSVTMSYYIKPWGSYATFILQGKNGKLEKLSGKCKGSEPLYLKNPQTGSNADYPSYEVITVNGITDIIEHRKMEPVFYITDDPAVWKELVGNQPFASR